MILDNKMAKISRRRKIIGIAGIALTFICGYVAFYFLIIKPATTWEIEIEYESYVIPLKLQVDRYGLTDWGNWGTFRVNGTITWTGESNHYIDNAKLSMYVYPKIGYKKTACLKIWSLSLAYPRDSYYTETSIPIMGGEQTPYPQSWNFSLSIIVYAD